MDSNETLYGGDPKFLSEINKLCETLIGQVLDHLKTLGRDEVRPGRKKKERSVLVSVTSESVLQAQL